MTFYIQRILLPWRPSSHFDKRVVYQNIIFYYILLYYSNLFAMYVTRKQKLNILILIHTYFLERNTLNRQKKCIGIVTKIVYLLLFGETCL
jgi:hypothetical protein